MISNEGLPSKGWFANEDLADQEHESNLGRSMTNLCCASAPVCASGDPSPSSAAFRSLRSLTGCGCLRMTIGALGERDVFTTSHCASQVEPQREHAPPMIPMLTGHYSTRRRFAYRSLIWLQGSTLLSNEDAPRLPTSERYPRRPLDGKRRNVHRRLPRIRIVQSFERLRLDLIVRVFSFS